MGLNLLLLLLGCSRGRRYGRCLMFFLLLLLQQLLRRHTNLLMVLGLASSYFL